MIENVFVVELRFGRVWVIGFVFSSHLRTRNGARASEKSLRPEILQQFLTLVSYLQAEWAVPRRATISAALTCRFWISPPGRKTVGNER